VSCLEFRLESWTGIPCAEKAGMVEKGEIAADIRVFFAGKRTASDDFDRETRCFGV
jgi:hypothetical protein